MAQLWLPRDLILESDLVERLFAWHGTPPEHHEVCRDDFYKADHKDLQYLMHPLVKALPTVSGKSGKTLKVKAERALLVSTDLDLMWEAFGAQTNVDRKDFRQCIETAPQEVFIGLIQYYAKLRDMSPLNLRAMNIEAARQAWAENSWESIDNGLTRFLANVKTGRKQTKAVAAKGATHAANKAPAAIEKTKSKAEWPSSPPSPDVEMPSSPPILNTVPRTTRAPAIPTPQTENNRIADEAFARASINVAAGQSKRVMSAETTPNTSRKGIEDEAFARAVARSTARTSKPPPSTKGTPDIAQKSFKDEAFARTSGNITAAKDKLVQSRVATPNTVPKSFADEAFARAMDSAAGKRKRAPSKDQTPDPVINDTHKTKRQRLTKNASANSSGNPVVVPSVETKLSSPVPVPSIETQKIPQNRQRPPQQAVPEKSLRKENVSQKMAPTKELTSKGRPPGLRELPGSKELTGATRPRAAEKPQKKASSLGKVPQKASEPAGSRRSEIFRRDKLSFHQGPSHSEEVSARLVGQDETASKEPRFSKSSEAAPAEKEATKAPKHWRAEEQRHSMETEQRAIVIDERDTIKYWREVEVKHFEEEKLRNQPEPQEIHRLELEKILEQRRIAEEGRSQQRSQQKDLSQRRKSQTDVQDSDKKRRKQTKIQQRKQRREAQVALARLQHRSVSPVKRRREATGTVSPPPIREVDDSTPADDFTSPMQDEEMVDSSKMDMSVSEIQNQIETENDIPKAFEKRSPVVQLNSALANSAGPSTPNVPLPACRTCRIRHRACDRVRPSCGECSKREVGCVWDKDAEVSHSKPQTSSHKKKPKNAVPELKACRTCNTKHRRCDRKGPVCGECSKNGRECVWSSDIATPNALAPVETTGFAEDQEQDVGPERVKERVQIDFDEKPDHEETPEERDMRQLASQLTTTQDEPASSSLLAVASPPIRHSQHLSQTAIPVLPPVNDEPIVQAHEAVYTASQASILAHSKANIISRMPSDMASSQASTTSEDSDHDVEEEVQTDAPLPVGRLVMVAVEVRPTTSLGRPDPEDSEASEDTCPEADISGAEIHTESVIMDEELKIIGPARPAAPEIFENDDEHVDEDVDEASDPSRADSEDLVLHDISGYDSADAEDEDLRDSEEEDEANASDRLHRRTRGFVDDLASESSVEEDEEAVKDSSDKEAESEEERGEEEMDAPVINWGESSDDEDDDSLLGKRPIDVHNVAAPAPNSGNLALIDAKPVVPAQTQTPESEDAVTQNLDGLRSGADAATDEKLLIHADQLEQGIEGSAQIDDIQQGSNGVFEPNMVEKIAKPPSPISASFDPDKHRSLRESLVKAIRQNDNSEPEIEAKLSQPLRSASPELGDANLLALSPSIFRHNIRSPSAGGGDSRHDLEVAESVYDDDDIVQYPELGDKLGRVSEDEPDDVVMDVYHELIPSVGYRPAQGPFLVDEKPVDTPTKEPDIQMIDEDSDFSEDDLAGAQEFPQSIPLEEYPDDAKFEPSQLEAMSPPERLTQLDLPDLPPGMVASQHPAVLYPLLPTMANVLSSPGEGGVNPMTGIEYTQTSPATSSSDEASAVTALEYSQESPESKPKAAPIDELPRTDLGPAEIAEQVDRNVGPKSLFFNPMIRSAWPTMRMGRK